MLHRTNPALIWLMSACTFALGCNPNSTKEQNQLTNDKARDRAFLEDMYADAYFPKPAVDKGKAILVDLCARIETEKPHDLEALYGLTHQATEAFNRLQQDFDEQGSELETAAREAIAKDFAFIAEAYGFDADMEELIAPREW